MVLHHIITITLFGGMIIQNQMRVGVIVSFIHNATDIMSNICRGSTQTVYSNVTVVTFFLNTFSWIYMRNIALPVITYACWTMADYPAELESFYFLHYYLSLFLTFLCAMNIYWTTLFFKMMNNYRTTGSNENIQCRDNFKKTPPSESNTERPAVVMKAR